MRKRVVKGSLLVIALTISVLLPILVVTAKKPEWVLEPVYIDETMPGRTWADWAAEPWCKGSGTEEDPYMIKNIVIDGEGSVFCMMIVSSRVFFKIHGCTFSNTKIAPGVRTAGLVLLNTSNGVIFKNKFFENGWPGLGQGAGIALISSHYNRIQKNLCYENEGVGIYLEWSSFNDVTKNDCTDNSVTGIVVGSSHGCYITKNFCSENGQTGIAVINLLDESTRPQDNIIYGNKVENNPVGIYFSEADNNDVFRNTIKENTNGMIVEGQSELNLIYQNNFIDNEIQAWNLHAGLNNWHNIYMLEGNYWSDYTGTDSDGDGIGDTPWPWPDYDAYPFMEKDGWEDTTPTEDELLNAWFYPDFNRLGGSRTVHANKTTYLMVGLAQLFSERRYDTWMPPYTCRLWFYGVEYGFQGTLSFFMDETVFEEPAWYHLFYIIIPPNYLTDMGFPLGWHEFQWEISFYSGGEQQFMTFTSYFNLI